MRSLLKAVELVISFADLPEGWNFGRGNPSAPLSLQQSIELLSRSPSGTLEDIEAFPGTDGEVQINFYEDEATLEMIFELDGTISVTLDEAEQSIRLGSSVSQDRALKFLKEFKFDKCRSFVFSTSRSTTALSIKDLLASPSGHQMTVVEYPLLKKAVARNRVAASAYTLRGITRAPQGRPQSFGRSRTNVSPKAANLVTA